MDTTDEKVDGAAAHEGYAHSEAGMTMVTTHGGSLSGMDDEEDNEEEVG